MSKNKIEEIVRVNQAGEMGAIEIYKGQLAVLKNKPIAKEIISMLKQEEKHYKTFSDLLIKHNIRPTLLSPLWKVGGFSLGVFTAILGKESTMACTEAVEEVIVKHYEQQTKYLKKNKNKLYKITSNFAKEEKEHMNVANKLGTGKSIRYTLLKLSIKSLSKLAIKVAKKI